MKKYIAAVLLFLVVASGTSRAQAFKTGFFLDNYQYGYRINPASMPSKSSLGIALTNISVAPSSSIGFGDILYPGTGNSLVTGFNSSVSTDEFLGNLLPSSCLSADVSENILSVVIRKNRSFGNFEINVRAIADAAVPYDLFAMLKTGTSEKAYDLSGLAAGAKAYIEIAYGKAYMIGDNLSVGARIKGLLGMANVTFDAGNTTANLQQGIIGADVNAKIMMSSKYLSCSTVDGGDVLDPSSLKFNSAFYGPTGYGAALDLGAVWKPVKGLEVSAAVQDLGAVRWDYNLVATSSASASFSGAGEMDITSSEGANAIADELQAQLDKLSSLADFHVQSGSHAGWEMLPFSANAGAKYSFARNILSVGALATLRRSQYLTSYDIRGGLTLSPVKWLSLAGTAGTGTFGPTMGAGLSVNLLTFNFHAGIDGYMGKTGSYALDKPVAGISSVPFPVGKFDCRLNLGLTLTFGERH